MLKAKFWTIPTTLAVCVLFSGGVQGATITVTKVEDINDHVCCSLRDAIAVAASGDTVTFDTGLFMKPRTITLTGGDISINKNLTITGVGGVRISGNNASRIFNLTPALPSGATFNFSDLTLTDGNGSGGDGGAINITPGLVTVNLINVTITSNRSSGNGGGIAFTAFGNLSITNSTISDNRSDLNGGGVYVESLGGTAVLNVTNSTVIGNSVPTGGGGIFTGGAVDLTVMNSAIIGNSVPTLTGGDGGGIAFFGNNGTITNTTISGNRATATGGVGVGSGTMTLTNASIVSNVVGGGLFVSGSTTARVRNSLVAGSTDSFSTPDIEGAITSQGNNLVQNRGTSTGYIASDLANGTDPLLDILKNNGGMSATHALLPTSPAINAGNNAFATGSTDQRGTGFPRINNGTIDIGAFESGRRGR